MGIEPMHDRFVPLCGISRSETDRRLLEARMGIAPMYIGFADQCLTAWLPGRISSLINPFAGDFLRTVLFLLLRFWYYKFQNLTTAMACKTSLI
ncbi:MAG: hypothetical protein UV53_C0001G0056 [Candidatus Azambacteria bacterium GW2011_GWE1_42_9]|nr:MAG: hypothetical protein UV39_C0032G0007 [Candidatus Azambacteria bacterium GW2011_GWA2_42_62]KKS79839.1 MAG: hypothetical protein UV53_C0001G0056 [Candidatus Azambacteria bacterium GW2011_GWE1_42_9]